MTAPDYWLVVPAAGRGLRFGGETPKQYQSLAGRTVLERALAPFLEDSRLLGVVVALHAADTRFVTLPLAGDPRVHVTTGGAERFASVAAGLRVVAAHTAPAADPWVLVHDAARPLIGRTDIDALLAALNDSADGALLGLPVVDSLKRAAADGRVESSVARTGLWRAQTPQAFRLSLLRRALDAAAAAASIPGDEAEAVAALGGRPRLVPGEPTNLKITSASDLALAERLLAGAHRPAAAVAGDDRAPGVAEGDEQ